LAVSLVAYTVYELEHESINEAVVLSQLPDAELEPHLRALVAKKSQGLAVVVNALGADRAALRQAAVHVLHEVIDYAAQPLVGDVRSQLDRLAQLLATYSPQFNREALFHAAELAERILARLPETDEVGDDRLRNCHIVFAAQAHQPMRQEISVARGNTLSASLQRDTGHSPIDLEPLAGGALPVVPAASAPLRLPNLLVAEARPFPAAGQRVGNSAESVASPLGSDSDISMNVPVAVLPTGSFSAVDDDLVHHTVHTEQMVSPVAPLPSSARSERELKRPDDLERLLELEKRTLVKDAAVADAARKELQRLRIDERQLSLARGAVDADPRVRIDVVEALPLIESVNARRWLLWFSYDSDAEVRRAAISLLATSADPELRRRVYQAAASDADPRVREQARAAVEIR
jgi:hypothetical protein